ncbi:MAG TPA: cytochrome c maturation protein CcmE [bacterium]|nr:cytochrome c maturation protein CcmE [bacterium]
MKPKIILGVAVIVAALIYLMVSSFRESSVYYMTVAEIREKGATVRGEGLRVSGYVDPATIQWDAQKIEVRFTMIEGPDSLHVYYKGVVPDQLADAQGVLAEGKLLEDGSFNATRLLLKCPSKYEARLEEDKTARAR